jgi:hypothetical protein
VAHQPVDPCQARQGQRPHGKAEVAQGDVVVASAGEQIDDDAPQPQSQHVGKALRPDGNKDAGGDFRVVRCRMRSVPPRTQRRRTSAYLLAGM